MLPSIEQHVDWIADCIGGAADEGRSRDRAASREAQEAWVVHVGDGRQHHPALDLQLLVRRRQHPRQAAGLHALYRRPAGLHRALRGGRGEGLRGLLAAGEGSSYAHCRAVYKHRDALERCTTLEPGPRRLAASIWLTFTLPNWRSSVNRCKSVGCPIVHPIRSSALPLLPCCIVRCVHLFARRAFEFDHENDLACDAIQCHRLGLDGGRLSTRSPPRRCAGRSRRSAGRSPGRR